MGQIYGLFNWRNPLQCAHRGRICSMTGIQKKKKNKKSLCKSCSAPPPLGPSSYQLHNWSFLRRPVFPKLAEEICPIAAAAGARAASKRRHAVGLKRKKKSQGKKMKKNNIQLMSPPNPSFLPSFLLICSTRTKKKKEGRPGRMRPLAGWSCQSCQSQRPGAMATAIASGGAASGSGSAA